MREVLATEKGDKNEAVRDKPGRGIQREGGKGKKGSRHPSEEKSYARTQGAV